MKMANYEKSYWKAVEIQEQLYEGKRKVCKRDFEVVIAFLREIQNCAFEADVNGKIN